MDMRAFNRYFVPIGAGLTLALAVMLVAYQRQPALSGLVSSNRRGTTGGMMQLAAGAFGTLGKTQAVAAGADGMRGAAPQTIGMGGGGGSALSGRIAESGTVGTGIVSPDGLPQDSYVQYTFTYKGEPLSLGDANVDVLRRVKNGVGTRASGDILAFAGDLVNLGSFPDMNLQFFTVSQEADLGYEATVDLRENTVSLNANYRKWPHPEQQCQDQACYERYRLKTADVPSDAAIISIASEFLKTHGIDTNTFGAPEVRNDWRLYAEKTADASQFSVPDSIAVVFPQLLDGRVVYDEGGYSQGIYASVNIRQNKVDGVWNLMNRSFESSPYAAETDPAKIIGIAEQGGLYGGYVDPDAKKVELALGTPTRVLLRMYNYKLGAYANDELYVPALLFPITQPEDGQPFYRQNIIVPLAKDLLFSSPIGVIRPLESVSTPSSAPPIK